MFGNLIVGTFIFDIWAKSTIDNTKVGILCKLQDNCAYAQFPFHQNYFDGSVIFNCIWVIFPCQIVVFITMFDVWTVGANANHYIYTFIVSQLSRELKQR